MDTLYTRGLGVYKSSGVLGSLFSFLLTSDRRDEAHHSFTTRLPLSHSKLDHIVSNVLFISA